MLSAPKFKIFWNFVSFLNVIDYNGSLYLGHNKFSEQPLVGAAFAYFLGYKGASKMSSDTHFASLLDIFPFSENYLSIKLVIFVLFCKSIGCEKIRLK